MARTAHVTHHHSRLIMIMAGIPYLRYCPHLSSAAAAEKPPHVAVGSPIDSLVCLGGRF